MDIGRFQPLIILMAAIIGLVIGSSFDISDPDSLMIELPLMALLLVLFLSVDLRSIGRSFLNVRFTSMALLLNFFIIPLLAYLLGMVFFQDSIWLRVGLIMLLVTPCTDWYLVFTGMSHGNVELGISILPLNLILQILLMPVYLYLFVGSGLDIGMSSLFIDAFKILVIPFVLALSMKVLIRDRAGLDRMLEVHGDNLQLLFLCIAVVAMFAYEGDSVVENPMLLLELFIPLGLFFITSLALSQTIGRSMHFQYGDTVALTFTTLARNSPLALAIAVSTFPDQPLVTLALVIGPLIELPILSLISWAILRTEKDYRPFGRSG